MYQKIEYSLENVSGAKLELLVLFCSDVKQLMGDELTACPAGVGALYSNWFFVNGNWPQMLRGDDCRLKGIYRYLVNGF